ncbi:DUF342 domain-containing protein [[Clostridium] colinum]|uniref:DUF342 domain-containing protein n=1 Tax=[Clostridium] colinum TaxID=36835 RepID=UPI0020246E8E|nr:FapA family protein [[Clostridium] colinum]
MRDILDRVVFYEDGIYFLVDYNKKNPKQDILYIINKYEIKDINYLELENNINNKEEYIFLTEDITAIDINETMKVCISEDKITAEVTFFPPHKNGKLLDKKEILEQIFSYNIKFGLNLSNIEDFIKTRDYKRTYLIARGMYPKQSQNGFLKYYVNIEEKNLRPKILDDGTIDYKTLDLFENVRKGDVLVEQVDPIKGDSGKNIYGEIVFSDEPIKSPSLPKGKNTEISKDGKKLISTINGCVFYRNNVIDILPILEIKSDINNSTGNIDFLGNVIVRGNVLNGFTIKAEGDVDIYGWVEGATIEAKGDIFIAQGVQGAGKAKLISDENINVSFIENATIICEKDINVNSLMHCNVFCNGNLTVLGKRGLILGGKSIISGNLIAKDIGSIMSKNTDITVGISYKVLEKYEEFIKILDDITERYNVLEKIVEKLSETNIEDLCEHKRMILEKSIKEKLEIKKKIFKYKEIIKSLIPLFNKTNSQIKVINKLYSGTKIVINNAIIFIKEDLDSCILRNVDGKIKVFK